MISKSVPSLAVLFHLAFISAVSALRAIDNGLAFPEVVHTPISTKPRCIVTAPPLDLIFLLDSSGSLRNKFQDEIEVIRRIVQYVTIGKSATRVMLIQFSGVQHLEFDFNKHTDRESLLHALDGLRFVSGITRTGSALEFALNAMTPEHGLRPANVPKILYLLSDGRTHDFPKDTEMAQLLRERISNLQIWAYGTGEYVAMSSLTDITQDPSKIVTNKNLSLLETQFEPWKGTEVCDKMPVCIRGSDKPLDLVLVIDSSDSVAEVFPQQVEFALERIVRHINVHPDAVRLSLVTFSGQIYTHFKFDDMRFRNNDVIANYLSGLRPITGTTSADNAINRVYELLTDPASETRDGVPKLAIVITDGRSSRSTKSAADRLRSIGVKLIAVSVNYPPNSDTDELLNIAGDPSHVFTPQNADTFERTFLQYVGFGCPGADLGTDPVPQVREATDITCDANSLTFTVRTRKPLMGKLYARAFHDDPQCSLEADGSSRQMTLTFKDGTCGLRKTPSADRTGYDFSISVIVQFHPLIVSGADVGKMVTCHYAGSFEQSVVSQLTNPTSLPCSYTVHRFSPDDCTALEAKLGDALFHKWQCQTPAQYRYLVHDCYAKSRRSSLQIIDSNGCQTDADIMATPDYSLFKRSPKQAYVFQQMPAFKFPGEDNIQFECNISLCENGAACAQLIPPKCSTARNSSGSAHARLRRDTMAQTVGTGTPVMNIIDNEAINPSDGTRYCNIR